MTLSRRQFLGGSVAALAAGTAGVVKGDTPEESTSTQRSFEGEHQAGIDVSPQHSATVVACDLQCTGREALGALLRTITERIRILMTGGRPSPDGIVEPATDSGELGPVIEPDDLTVTVGVGASLFDARFGLARQAPAHLSTMEPFEDDVVVPQFCHGDLVLQLCAQHQDTVTQALRDILRHTRGVMTMRWMQSGYQNPPRPEGTQRNHFGFKDGTVNPRPEQFEQLVWAGSGEPPWAVGGSYMVVRLIRMFTEFWDRISIAEQEQIFGRVRATGGPLSGGGEFDEPVYSGDSTGDVIPLDSHIRLANPRTAETSNQLMLRRAYNYNNGLADNGTLDVGLLFICYQQDLERQFITMQKRLAGEPLADYIRPFGGGYFFALPGVTDSSSYLGRTLIES